MADKYQAGGALLADSEEFLTGKDGTFSGTVSGIRFPSNWRSRCWIALSNWYAVLWW